MTIINIRGTGGSGKSTVVTRIMDVYSTKEAYYVKGRKRPYGYTLYNGTLGLYVPGHYEIACGGCDTLKSLTDVFDSIDLGLSNGMDVLYEGIMAADDVTRTVALSKRSKLHVILLTTPIGECLAAITARREAKGNVEPLNPKNTIARERSHRNHMARLADAGVHTYRLDREGAYLKCRELLGV